MVSSCWFLSYPKTSVISLVFSQFNILQLFFLDLNLSLNHLISLICVNLIISNRFMYGSMLGSRTQEAFEAFSRAEIMDVG